MSLLFCDIRGFSRISERLGPEGTVRWISQVMGAKNFKVEIGDLPTVNRIAEACLAIDAFARAQPLRQRGAPASH